MSALAWSEQRRRLRAARAVWRTRSTHATRGDRAYTLYVIVLAVLFAGVPLVRAAVLVLAQADALALFASPPAAIVVSASAAATWIGALVLGRMRGPVCPPPFVAAVWGSSELPARAVWGGRAARALTAATLALTAVAALAGSGFLVAGQVVAVLTFLAAALAFAATAAVLWLAGQVLAGRIVTAAAFAVAAWAVLGLTFSFPISPWDALAATWPGSAPTTSGAGLFALALLAVAALACAPALVARLRPETVLAHARRGEAITLLARTGDLAGAFDRLRLPPTVGRRWSIPLSGPLWFATLQRDAVSAARHPGRLIVGFASLIFSGACWVWMPSAPDGLAWMTGVPAALAGFAGLGAFCGGLHAAVDSSSRPPLFPQRPGALLTLHLVFPGAAALVVPTSSALLLSGQPGPSLVAAASGALLVALRTMDAAKPPLPIELLMPVPTPVGDASAAIVAIWQFDAVLIALAIGLWQAPALLAAGGGGVLLLVAFGAVITGITIGRLRGLRAGG